MKNALYIGLAVFAAAFLTVWVRAILRARRSTSPSAAPPNESAKIRPSPGQLLLGFATNFFDALGIGNFAPTAAVYRLTGMVEDDRIPGTMNVGHTLPVVVMAFAFLASVEVESTTLVTLLAAAVCGAWFGAGVVARLPKRAIRIGMGIALLIAAALMTLKALGGMPGGGDALGLETGPLIAAAVCVALLGALNTIGIGLYAPCMILIALLGMDPKAAFPIMMGSCAFLMPVGSARFVLRDAYDLRPALGLTLGGIPAVFIAVYIVESLPLQALVWLVVGVATYTAVTMLWSARTTETSCQRPDS